MDTPIHKYGVADIDNDPLCICLGKYLEDPLYRNILKIEEKSDYCMCLYDGIWVAVPDSKAISEFIIKHIPDIQKQASTFYENLTDTAKPELKQNIETLMFIIHEILEGNEVILVYVYDIVKKLLYHVTKRFNKDDIIHLHTKVQRNRVTTSRNTK